MLAPSDVVGRLSAVSHNYGRTVALANVSVEVPARALVGIVGPDGVGKSTLLGLLAGARKIQAGQVSVLGGDMADPRHRSSTCHRIAYMPQGLGKNLYADLSVFENLDFFGRLFGLAASERRARMATLLRATGLESFESRPAGNLSGGMKQKLGLCCALIHDPDFLILDEPTTGVDPLSRRRFWDLIDQMRDNAPEMSVVVSTAYMDEAERFDWLIAMDSGNVLASGTPEDLRRKTGTETLEDAFVQLLPEEKRGSSKSPAVPPPPPPADSPAIVARGLTMRFGDFTAVHDVSFTIERGEIFGFLGSNGCGKTTTMKMLTGLLPPSSGEAELFGRPLDTHGPETRRRVGYMSQSFSLYGELTVLENLELHARLFRLPRERILRRVGELMDRFGLTARSATLASALPLGVRQRLSLAVAIIHDPELLILDEPTSGVDPVARDSFWALLIDLSRNDHVTIFISTHVMSEAMRCDRISLMHAGHVLACDKPAILVDSRGAPNLEEAFIEYIRDASGTTSKDAKNLGTLRDAEPILRMRSRVVGRSGLSFNRLFAYTYREALEVLRDPIRLAFAFGGSAVLMLIFVFGITMDVEDVRYAVLDLDQTPESRAYLRAFEGSRYFAEQPSIQTQQEAQDRLQSNDVSLVLEMLPHFGRDLHRGFAPAVSAWVDGAMPFRGETVSGYVSGVHAKNLEALATNAGASQTPAQVTIQPRYRYNPSFESIYAIAPGIPPILLILIPSILMAVSIAREKELGTITNFYVTPTTRLEFLLGKQLPYVAIGFLNFLLLMLMTIFLFQVPLKGSATALVLGAILYVTTTSGLGLLTSTITRSQVAAVFATAILTMMPTVQFSGLLQPVSTLEGGARVIGSLWPAAYYNHLSVGAFTKGLGISDLTFDLVALASFIPVFTLVSALALRKQDR
ncbi:MAG: ABC transporter ATP-binding protein/permease [Gammaproteobacteria bacterium]|nr:MAG: ABC transporter ATP-binding protein/permease [Gammaproteobacteria bacterium]